MLICVKYPNIPKIVIQSVYFNVFFNYYLQVNISADEIINFDNDFNWMLICGCHRSNLLPKFLHRWWFPARMGIRSQFPGDDFVNFSLGIFQSGRFMLLVLILNQLDCVNSTLINPFSWDGMSQKTIWMLRYGHGLHSGKQIGFEFHPK